MTTSALLTQAVLTASAPIRPAPSEIPSLPSPSDTSSRSLPAEGGSLLSHSPGDFLRGVASPSDLRVRSSPALAGDSAVRPSSPSSSQHSELSTLHSPPPTPVTEYLTEFQAALGKQLRSLRLTDPAMGQALANYASLLTVATVERIHDACFHNANNPKLPALIKELNKAQSNLDRANARAKREQFLKEKELRRIQRDQDRKERDKQRIQHQRERDQARIKTEELKLQRAKIESQTKADERAHRKTVKTGKSPQ